MKKNFFILISLFICPLLLWAEQDDAPPQGQYWLQTLIMIALIIVFVYFLMYKPEQKRRDALENFRKSLQKGDKVTAMGIVGIVHSIKEHTMILKMVDGTKIEFLKDAVSENMLPNSDSSQETNT